MIDSLWIRAILLAIGGCIIGVQFAPHVLGLMSAAVVTLALIVAMINSFREREQAVFVHGIQLVSFIIPMWIVWLGSHSFA